MPDYRTATALDLLATRASLHPHREVIKDVATGQKHTYSRLNIQANALANYFTERLNLKKGDRVAMLSRNAVECLVAFFAVQKTGLVLVPLNWRLSVPEILNALEQTTPRVLLYDASFAEHVEEIREGHAFDATVYWLEDENNYGVLPGISLARLLRESSSGFSWPHLLDWEDPLMILFTGGTTGPPKGAVLTQRTVFFNMLSEALSWNLQPGQVIPVVLPFFHTGGWNLLTLPSLFAGAKILVFRGFDPGEVLRQIEKEQCRTLFAAPTMFQMISSSEEWPKTNLGSLEWVMSGAAPCSKGIMEPYWEKGVPFVQGYGITEGGPNNLYMPWYSLSWEEIRSKWSSVGRPFLYCYPRVVDDEGNPVEQGERGELVLEGPVTFAGYWQRPRETSQVLQDGRVHTGDIAMQDEDGYFYIVDRKKDMFISGGENVFPVEVETALKGHPAVKDAAVIGVTHERWGEVGKAFVVTPEGSEVSGEELKGFLRHQLAGYKVPVYYCFVASIPKNSVGKVLKKELREE